ncbi:MAG: ribosome biogenesis GTP-binding protein YsxC [Gemmatimonadales bacterium]|nr:ribosome biogenesis GTP-binding protein YsxC [Gemmatimonadales bacterium]
MHHGAPSAAGGHGTGAGQEGGLIVVTFVGSFPAADFRLEPARPEICFLGRSNVGKSSLINAFAGRQGLARTSRTPGKTRLCNVFDVDGGFYLVDLPGYGFAQAGREVRRGLAVLVREYLERRKTLAGAVWLLDVRREPSPDDLAVAELLHARQVPLLVAVTKADKFGRGRRLERARAILEAVGVPEDQCIVTSVLTRDGIEDLRESVLSFVSGGYDTPGDSHGG